MNEQVPFATMSDREKYLFDLQGFLVIAGFLTPGEVAALNTAIDANTDKRGEHVGGADSPRGIRNGRAPKGLITRRHARQQVFNFVP